MRNLALFVIAFWLAVIVVAVLAVEGNAHEALHTVAQPLGWEYPGACCGGQDCRRVDKASIIESPKGYIYTSTGELLGYNDKRIRPSPDGEYHVCTTMGKENGNVICLFALKGGS